MRKIFLIIGISVFIFANNDKFLEYTNKLVTYHFELKNIDKIKSPFFKVKKENFLNNKDFEKIKKIVHISLISIFDNSAYLKIEEFKGDELIKTYKKWVKIGDKIENCKITKITSDKVILKCDKKVLVKRLNNKSLKVRIEK